MNTKIKYSDSDLKRFQDKYQEISTGCWEWTASNTGGKFPYGKFWLLGEYMKAHRASYKMFVGGLNSTDCVLHKCDNPKCVNPDHLFLGSKKDNALDMLSKGRGGHHKNPPRGDRRKDSKLTNEAVLSIRKLVSSGYSQGSVAKMYGIGQPTVHKIVHRQRWAHV